MELKLGSQLAYAMVVAVVPTMVSPLEKPGASRVRHKLEAGKGLISQVGAVRGLAQGHQLFL